MAEINLDHLEHRSLLILGFGREGQASYTLLRSRFPHKELAIADASPAIAGNPLLAGDNHLVLITGDHYLQQVNRFDLVLRSPGIPVWNLDPPIPPERITSQTDIFLQAFASQVTGVTGTKGKSTTASLIHHIFKTAGSDSILVGNIGNPAFHYIGLIGPATKIVFELSSHQLEYLQRSPSRSVFLNLFQEHLDAYRGYAEYQQAKVNIARYQHPGDQLVYHAGDPLVSEHIASLGRRGGLYPFSLAGQPRPGCYLDHDTVMFDGGEGAVPVWRIHQDRFLRGEHNLKNIMAAISVAMLESVPIEAIEEGIATFKGLEHRLEYVGEFNRIHFYNDSIATIPEATIEAIRAIPGVDTLVAGGFDRGIDYTALATFLSASPVRNLILIGAAGRRIGQQMEESGSMPKRLFYVNRFDHFYEIACRETTPGSVCLLSPAAASYDEFRNFEERGKRFRELVSKTQ